jgi:hypothetical protein
MLIKKKLLLEKDSIFSKTYFYCIPTKVHYNIYKITNESIYIINENIRKWPKTKEEERNCFYPWFHGEGARGYIVVNREKYPGIIVKGYWNVI